MIKQIGTVNIEIERRKIKNINIYVKPPNGDVLVTVPMRVSNAVSYTHLEEQGFEVYTSAEAAKKADIIMILINDEKQAKLYKESIEPNLEPGNMLMFAHGFNIHFGCITPPKDVDVTMIAPKAPGHTVRSEYQAGKGTPCLVAVEQDATGKALDLAPVSYTHLGNEIIRR